MQLTFSNQTIVEFHLTVQDAYSLLDGNAALRDQLREEIHAHEDFAAQHIAIPTNGNHNHRTPRAKKVARSHFFSRYGQALPAEGLPGVWGEAAQGGFDVLAESETANGNDDGIKRCPACGGAFCSVFPLVPLDVVVLPKLQDILWAVVTSPVNGRKQHPVGSTVQLCQGCYEQLVQLRIRDTDPLPERIETIYEYA